MAFLMAPLYQASRDGGDHLHYGRTLEACDGLYLFNCGTTLRLVDLSYIGFLVLKFKL